MAIDLKKVPRALYDFTKDWDDYRRDAPNAGADLRKIRKAGLLTQSLRAFADGVQQFDAKFLLLQKLMEELKRNSKPGYVNDARKLGNELKPKSLELFGATKEASKILKEVDRDLLDIINEHYGKKTPADKKTAETLRIGYQRILGPLRMLLEQSDREFTRISRELAQGLVDLDSAPAPKLDDDHILCPHCKRVLSIKDARKKMASR